MTEGEIAEAVRDAAGPVRVRGGGTRSPADGGAALDVSGHSGIALYEPGALTLVAKAGTPVAEIDGALAARGQRLAFEPHDLRGLLGTSGEPTIGGVVATNASGPRRVQSGACRDFLLGVRFVTGEGEIVKNGGRVMKNVTGYDLARLMCGSRGTLGVLTEVALKVLPRPAASASLAIPCDDAARAVAAMSAALGTPYEVTGAAWDGDAVHLRIEGFADSVAYRTGALAEAMAPHGRAGIDREGAPETWAGIRDAAPFHGTRGDVWRISVRPSHAPGVIAALGASRILLDWGGGLVWAECPPGTDLRARLDAPGHATRVRGQGSAPMLHPEAPAVAALTAGLRRRFDPNGVFGRAA